MEVDSDIEQDKIEIEARQGDTRAKIQVGERRLSKRVDTFAHGFAKKMGYEAVPWYILTEIVLGIYTVLTLLSMFFRPDFFNVSFKSSLT